MLQQQFNDADSAIACGADDFDRDHAVNHLKRVCLRSGQDKKAVSPLFQSVQFVII
jgi:hypothetical protein